MSYTLETIWSLSVLVWSVWYPEKTLDRTVQYSTGTIYVCYPIDIVISNIDKGRQFQGGLPDG